MLLRAVAEKLRDKGYVVGNVDATVIAQRPKLRPYIPQMIQNIAEDLEITEDQVNVKATTEEHLGFSGREEGIAASAVCLINSFYEGSFSAADSFLGGGCSGCPGRQL